MPGGAAAPAANDFEHWLGAVAARTEASLAERIAGCAARPESLAAGMRYAVLGGGKRIRPALVHAAGRVSGADPAVLDRAACAVELIHAYSLVHDDMPCMDDDVLRRGKPTVHVAFGEAAAMLVGDALQALAFESLASITSIASHDSLAPKRSPGPHESVAPHAGPGAGSVVAMVAELARAAGAAGMAGGQAIDLASVGATLERDALEDMHRRKTGALLRASVRLGGLAGDALDGAAWSALDEYADAVGLAFQVVDDVLDVEGDAATIGKTAGKDRANDKPTYVSVLGLSESKRLAAGLHERALHALAPLGGRASRLAELATLIVTRRA